MPRITPSVIRAISLGIVTCLTGTTRADDPGFEPIFDGTTLTGWAGQDMSFWSVEDGAITGTIAPDHAPPMNQYLVWQGGLVEDFELKLDFRLTGSTTPNTNGGFQFRSRRLPDGDVGGYQVDNNFGQPWKARLYDEFGRHDLAREGERSTFGPDGKRTVEPLPLEPGATDFRLDDWHEYHLTAVGPKLELRVNGKLIAETTDGDPDSYEPRGVLAMQLHTGPPMKAQFRNIRLKRIGQATPPDSREALIAAAALHWDLGERPDAHQPPLKAQGDVRRSIPVGASGVRFATLKAAYFDAKVDLNRPTAWNVPGDALTVHVRARVSDGAWTTALFSKGGPGDGGHFRLFGHDLPDTPGPDLGFEVRTEQGTAAATFMVSRVDPGAWHDLVGRYDGRAVQIYCDGRLMDEQPASGKLAPNDEPVLIGAEAIRGQPTRPFTGEIEEASLWTRALTDAELATVTTRR